MKKLLLTAIFAATSLFCFAQNTEQKTIIQKNNKETIESVEFSSTDKSVQIPASADVFLKDLLKIQKEDRFEKISHKSKKDGFIHEHLDQYYKGIKVAGAGYNFHYKNGEMFFAHGHYVKIENLNVEPAITENEAKESFARYKNIPLELVTDYLSELLVKEISINKDTIPMLVYKINLIADHENNTEIGFVDAQTGKMLATEPIALDYTATGTFATRYSGIQTGITHYYNGAFHLVDSTAGRAIIHTWNLNGGTNIANSVELSDNDNNWTQAEHTTNDNNAALDVHWGLQQIRNRLFVTHEKNSFNDDNDNPQQINAYIRDNSIPQNAQWRNNALFFGAGGATFRVLTSLDVVAHEFGHGITQFQIGWNGGDQNAFNEGMSDIWGAIMEQGIRPNIVWQIGEQITINSGCLRNLQNTNDNAAATKIADTYGTTQYNNATNTNSGTSPDRYIRGGVFSHWFYLLTTGGSGTNGIGNSYQVYGIGMDNAENLIVEAVFNQYLSNTTTYAQIRTATVNAARVLDGSLNGFLAQQVENAWYAVGVGTNPAQLSFSGPSYFCTTGTYQVNNLPSGASFSVQTSNPSHFTTSISGNTITITKPNTMGIEGWVAISASLNSATIAGDTIHFLAGKYSPVYPEIFHITSTGGESPGWCTNQDGNRFRLVFSFTSAKSDPAVLQYEMRLLKWPSGTLAYTYPGTFYGNYDTEIYYIIPNPNTSNNWYEFQVRNVNCYSNNEWIPIGEVEFVDCSQAWLAQYMIYPNPNKGIFTLKKLPEAENSSSLSAQSSKAEMLTLRFYTAKSGVYVKELTVNILDEVTVNTIGLPKGSYIVRIAKGKEQIASQMVQIE